VLKARHRLRLGAKAGQFGLAGVAAGQDHLQGDDAAQTNLTGLVDDAHAAPAQFLQHLVAGDRRQSCRAGVGRRGRCESRQLAVR
jgi:hypothetical protein